MGLYKSIHGQGKSGLLLKFVTFGKCFSQIRIVGQWPTSGYRGLNRGWLTDRESKMSSFFHFYPFYFQGFVAVHRGLTTSMGIERFDRRWSVLGILRFGRRVTKTNGFWTFSLGFIKTHISAIHHGVCRQRKMCPGAKEDNPRFYRIRLDGRRS